MKLGWIIGVGVAAAVIIVGAVIKKKGFLVQGKTAPYLGMKVRAKDTATQEIYETMTQANKDGEFSFYLPKAGIYDIELSPALALSKVIKGVAVPAIITHYLVFFGDPISDNIINLADLINVRDNIDKKGELI